MLSALLVRPCVYAKSLQFWPTLCNPIYCSPPGSSVHGILQARILELVAISFPRGSYQPRSSGPTFQFEERNGTWNALCDPKSYPTYLSHLRETPRFPAELHLSHFSPPDRHRRVDSSALSGRVS